VVHFSLAAVGVPMVALSLVAWVRDVIRQHHELPEPEETAPPAEEPPRERVGPSAR
jgi:hypothetical protein